MGNNVLGKKLLLIGGGGHCHSVLDSVLALNEYENIGIIDAVNCRNMGIPVIGTDDDIPSLVKDGWTYGFITVGSVGDTRLRRKLYDMMKAAGLTVPNIIDPSAVIAQNIVMNEGIYVGKRAVINAGVTIDKCAIINTGAIIEHDCYIGEFSHVSPGSILCGQVVVEDDSHIGAGSVVRQQVLIGNNVLIGIGSTVVKNIPDGKKAYGNPCEVVE